MRANKIYILITFAITLFLPCIARAENAKEGIYRQNDDWEIACDNTRTCRIAGYHADQTESRHVTILLTRAAGPQKKLNAQLQLGDFDISNDSVRDKLPAHFSLTMVIDEKDFGAVPMDAMTLTAALSEVQVNALAAALSQGGSVSWTYDDIEWELSTYGAASMLLEMDKAQGRLNTSSALIQPGSNDDSSVLPAIPMPELRVPFKIDEEQTLVALSAPIKKKLLKELKASISADDCEDLTDISNIEPELSAYRIAPKKLLVSTMCMRAPYNANSGYWVVNDRSPFRPVLVTLFGTEFAHGVISDIHKGRGIGDCLTYDEWAWNGSRFIQSSISSTGKCKEIVAGGAWDLPTFRISLKYKH